MLACLSYLLGPSLAEEEREYLNGAIIIDRVNENDRIKEITFFFRDNQYYTTFTCDLLAENMYVLSETHRSVYDSDRLTNEEIYIFDFYSRFNGVIKRVYEVERTEYINHLVNEITVFYDNYHELAADENITGITFYPKIINGKVCTALEYTQSREPSYWSKNTAVDVVGLFMPLNETRDGMR